jgi:1-deoxy-D-xylulose-5-phosphate reductoisomerase
VKALHFEKPDVRRFPCLGFGYEAKRRGGTLPAVVNAANETAVEAFLSGRASFTSIPKTIEQVMTIHSVKPRPSLADILEADRWARDEAERLR